MSTRHRSDKVRRSARSGVVPRRELSKLERTGGRNQRRSRFKGDSLEVRPPED